MIPESVDTQPTNKPNIQGSSKVGFVGGAADARKFNRIVKSKYEAYIQKYGADSARYFEWTDSKELALWIDQNKGAVTVIGHSYGGGTAAGIVAAGHQVYKLVTVDPVGWFRPDMQAVANNAVIWNNFDAAGSHGTLLSFWNNTVATVGGAWNSAPDGYATNHVTSPYHDHMSICSAYCRP